MFYMIVRYVPRLEKLYRSFMVGEELQYKILPNLPVTPDVLISFVLITLIIFLLT
jgi:hypothetical protein